MKIIGVTCSAREWEEAEMATIDHEIKYKSFTCDECGEEWKLEDFATLKDYLQARYNKLCPWCQAVEDNGQLDEEDYLNHLKNEGDNAWNEHPDGCYFCGGDHHSDCCPNPEF